MRQQVSVSHSLPAPLKGLNLRDALAAMTPMHAVALDNFFPGTSYAQIRGGFADHVTGLGALPQTLAVYNRLNGTSQMFAATSTGVFDVTSAGVAGASLAVRSNAKHQHLNFGDGTNNYLMMFNGVDKPLFYNGTTWVAVDGATSPALTGVATTSLVSAFASKGRLFFIEKDSLSFWYLAAGAAGGALTRFPLDGVAKRGGYIMAGANWTFDGRDGLDDAVVFATSEGEVIVYKGTNPSSSTAWALSGVFDLGEPLGRRCFVKVAGDLILICQNGAFPLSAALQSAAANSRFAITNIIENGFNEKARSYGGLFGWEATLFPGQSALILNIPNAEGGTHEQYVMNTITKAWCRFAGWDAETFTVFNGALYFATGTRVVQAWTGASDGGSYIVAYGKTAFSYFGRPGVSKRVQLFRPVLAVNGPLSFLTGTDVDFRDAPLTGVATSGGASEGLWGVALWGVALWGEGLEVIRNWTSPPTNEGYTVSGKIRVATKTLTVQWMSNDFVFETGGVM
jgi:hypothetical protein